MSRVTFHDTRWAPLAYRCSAYLAAYRAKVDLGAPSEVPKKISISC